MTKKPSISVFFPCYNDSKSIGFLIQDAFSVLKKLTDTYEVTVIDDYSSDNSRQVLKKYQKKYKKLKLIFHDKNFGYGGTLRDGFNTSRYDLIFYTDGDGQYDVKELPLLMGLMTQDVNFINGVKMARKDPTYRIFIGNLYSFATRWLFWLPIIDIDCDFRLIRRDLIKKIDIQSSTGAVCIELVKKAERKGGKFRQVSVHHFERRFGRSQFFRPRRLLLTFADVGKLWLELMVWQKLVR